MDRETLSQYGWVTICIIIIVILIALATPFGNYISAQAKNAVTSFGNIVKDSFANANVDYDEPTFGDGSGTGGLSGGGTPNQHGGQVTPNLGTTNYTAEQIAADDHLFAVGATQPEYVVAAFNNDYSEVVFTKNGANSDGLMIDFGAEYDEYERHYDTYADESKFPYTVDNPESVIENTIVQELDGYIMPIIYEGMENGKFDDEGNPISEDAFSWFATRLYEDSNGWYTFNTDTMALVECHPSLKRAIIMEELSENNFSYYYISADNNSYNAGYEVHEYSTSMALLYNKMQQYGYTYTPTALTHSTLKTITFQSGISNIPAQTVAAIGFEDEPAIEINISSDITNISEDFVFATKANINRF